MKLIHENPYRIAGILSNATERELQRQQSKIKKFAKIGREADSELDFNFLNPVSRSEENVNKAFSNIEQNGDKVSNSLFWFIKSNPFDETALNYLINGDKEKALEIWEKITNGKEITAKNFSCFNNIGTLKLLGSNQSEIADGISLKFKLLDSDSFADFVHSVADQTYSIDNKKQAEKLVDTLLSQLNGKYTLASTAKLFDGCNSETKKYISKKFTEKPIHNLEARIESTKSKRKQDKFKAYDFGLKLFVDSKEDLASIKSMLGASDLKFKMISDNLAKEILQCGIDYFQAWIDSKDVSPEGLKLLKYANSIAIGTQTKDRIRENIEGIEEMKERELNQAVALLQSVKDAYESNEANIRKQIEELKENDIELKFGLKTINHRAVEENIRNSIDWSKVNELLNEVLPNESLKKIKECTNTEAKKEFWELANWLEDNSLKSSTISNIIEKYKKISPKLYFEILSSEITNTDSKSNSINKPFYIEDIRYVGIKLKVKSNGTQKVTIYKKYVNPEGKYSHSSEHSPEGYTSSKDIIITPETREIDLGGWGSGKECTYKTGEHKIEVYVEHFKIHSKSFTVDWSPSKKSELTKRLNLLQNELKEVQKFKWFRMTETKEKEVREVQTKIDKTKKILMNK